MSSGGDDSFLTMRREIAARVGGVLEQSLRESSMIAGARQVLSEASLRMEEESDPRALRHLFSATLRSLDVLLAKQGEVRREHFSRLSDSLRDSLRMISALERIQRLLPDPAAWQSPVNN